MECVTCHATIADKAIVCYRCGTPTASPAELRRASPTASKARPWGVVGVCIAVAAAFGVAATRFPSGSWTQVGLVVAAVLAVAVGCVSALRR